MILIIRKFTLTPHAWNLTMTVTLALLVLVVFLFKNLIIHVIVLDIWLSLKYVSLVIQRNCLILLKPLPVSLPKLSYLIRYLYVKFKI